MPTYEYACDSCGEHFEAVQKMSDKPLDSCPQCKKAVKRILSGGLGIRFMGSGFYATDSSLNNNAKKVKHEKTPKSGSCCAGCPNSK